MTDQTQLRLTTAEYARLPETNQPMELIEGEVIMSPSPIPSHQRTTRQLYDLLIELISNGEVFFAPLDVYLDEVNVVQPDVFWLAEDGACKEIDDRLVGPPDLIVEVLLPSSLRHDRSVKFLLYEKHSVPEYWIADPHTQQLEVWTLKDAEYTLVGSYGSEGKFASPRLGREVHLSGVFPTA